MARWRQEMPIEAGILLLNRYRIERLHRLASESAVYLAVDTVLNAPVAVKENLMADGPAQEHFAVEASILAGLRHPNIPRGLDAFTNEDGQFLVMEFLEGEDLSEWIAHAAPSAEELVRILEGVFDAVVYLHSLEPPVIHRDIEPSNIVLTTSSRSYLVDFGQAKRFVPPNVALGEGVLTDERSDQYSLAATIFAILTGSPPPDSIARLQGRADLPPIAAIRPDVSPRIEQAIVRALSLRPSDRHKDVRSFRRALSVKP